MSPALAGGFLTTAPPGKPLPPVFVNKVLLEHRHGHLFIIDLDYFCATMAELYSCDRDCGAAKPKIFTM